MSTNYVYFILDEVNQAVKIGQTTNIKKRLKSLQSNNINSLRCVKSIEDKNHDLEAKIQYEYSHLHIHGEWFRLEGELREFLQENLRNRSQHIVTKKIKNNNVNRIFQNPGSLKPIIEHALYKKEIPSELSDKRRQAGLRGGQATLERYGQEHMRMMGKLGGRPRKYLVNGMPTQAPALNHREIKVDEKAGKIEPQSLKSELKELMEMSRQ